MADVTLYVCGPMSGIRHHNFEAFDDAAADLRKRGFEVVSPAELDSTEVRERVMRDEDGKPTARQWARYLTRDLRLIATVDEVVVLHGWQHSRGARIECFWACLLGLPIRHYPSMRAVSRSDLERAFGEAAALGRDEISAVLKETDAVH